MARIRQVIKDRIFRSALYFLFYVPFIVAGILMSIYATWLFILFVVLLLVFMYFSLGTQFIQLWKTLMPIYRASKYNYDLMLKLIQDELKTYKTMDESEPVYTTFNQTRYNNLSRATRFSRINQTDRTKLYALYMRLEDIALRNKPKKDIMEY